MVRFLSLAGVALAAALCATPGSFAAEGYWRYVDTQFRPSEAELQVLGKTPGRVDEKHVKGGFQPKFSGEGTLELYFKNDDVDRHIYISRLLVTYGASKDMSVLVPGDVIDVEGSVSFESNFPAANGRGTVAVDNGDYFVDVTVGGKGQASGKGSFKVPGGGPGSTLRYIAGGYIGAYGGLGETMTNLYEWVEGAPPDTNPPDQGSPPSGKAGDFGGKWTTTEGDMDLAQSGSDVTGTYVQDNGRVAGDVSDGKLAGYWGEDSSGVRCDTERLGTFYWGRIEWTLSDDGNGFSGSWSYCDQAPAGVWSGSRSIEEME
ncbi:MAG: hypothetical protein HY834_02320 [Devosia nanyangense]|uniref:Uncharacterized protein n=1 Tax=Devosia nanyangense TaxID=1228055 RepID=A0A933NXF2_9HYPH|nr:hypothetical protein [Devosia nanyangense]